MRMDILLILFLMVPWMSWEWLGNLRFECRGRAPEAASTQPPMEFQAAPVVQPRRELEP
jgi:hypothetical protein